MEYDAFGRVGRIRPPDGAAHDVTMTYVGDRVVQRRVQVATSLAAESTALTVERYDRQRRLYQVVEPSGANNANVTTTYSYDVGNRLSRRVARVSQRIGARRHETWMAHLGRFSKPH